MKRLIIGFFILIALLISGFAAAIMTLNSIDWSEYEEPIANAVREATGRELHFNGALKVNIGLSPGISASGITVQNADWASGDEMLTIEHVAAYLQLLPLIVGRVELSRFEVVGLDLLLETNQQGRGNWEFGPAGNAVPDSADHAPALVPDDETLLTATVLKNVMIRDARVVYKDGASGVSQRFSIARFAAQMDSASAPFVFNLVGACDAESVELAGEIDGIAGLLNGAPLGLDLTVSMFGATAAIRGSIGQPLAAAGIELAVDITGDFRAALLPLAGDPIPDLGTYRIAANIVGTTRQLNMTNLSIDIADMQVDGNLKVDLAGEPLRLEATLHSPRIDLPWLLPADDSVEPAPADVTGTSGQPDDQKDRIFPDDPLPLDEFDALESINAVVTLAIDELIIDPETTVMNLATEIHAAAQTISAFPLEFSAGDATIDGRVGIEIVRDAAVVAVALHVRHPDLGNLVEVGGDTTLTGGPVDLDIDVTGSGASIRHIMASLNGSLAVELGAARVSNAWVQRAFAEVAAILTKRAPQYGATEPIELHCAVTDFRIRDGVAVTDNFVIDARNIALFGDGRIDLRDESLHLDFAWLATDDSTRNALPPFKIRGTLAAPAGRFDTKALLGNALGLAAEPVTGSDAGLSDLAAASGPERCRQRLVVYEQIREERKQPQEITVESVLKDIETTKDALRKLGGFFRKKK